MKLYIGNRPACLLCASCLLLAGTVHDAGARQNVVSGDVAAQYDFQERSYETNDIVDSQGRTVIILDDTRGDRRNYILQPRISFFSTGINDVFELTAAPALNYDDLYSTTDIDWDFRLRGEKNLTKDWNLVVADQFYQGDDPVRNNELQTAVISPDTGEVVADQSQVGVPAESGNPTLTDRVVRHRYDRNELDLSTEYTYAQDSVIGGGYRYGILRNKDSDEVAGGYADYDRHDGNLNLSYRFTPQWQAEGEGQYIQGLFDDTAVVVVNDDAEILPLDSNDLEEYNFQGRVNYNYNRHMNYFTQYSYMSTDYDSELREDYNLNEFLIGLDYDVSQHVQFTVSAGPVIGSFENTSTDTDYSVYGGLAWAYMHGTLNLVAEKGYDQSNFDGRQSGLTGFWRTSLSLDYQLTEDLQASLSTSYWNNDRLQYTASSVVIVDPESPEFGRTIYTEKSYDAGVSLAYTFARWYQLSGGYRYYNHESDLTADVGGNYDEHRVFVQLSYAHELFRW